jgi:GNAT superfamily N-acetyltransferase
VTAYGVFRLASHADTDALLDLMRAKYAGDGVDFHADAAFGALERLLDDPSLGEVWIAEREDAAVAYMILTLGYSLEYLGRDAFIDELYVAPEARRQGLATEALERAEAICRARGVHAIHLAVTRTKMDAVQLYEGAGFVDHDRKFMTKPLR